MRKIAICLSLLLALGLTSAVAQGVSASYLGTMTVTPTVYELGDPTNVNTEIKNQTLETGENSAGKSLVSFPAIPIYKEGDPINIGFPNYAVAANGDISAPSIDSDDGTLTFNIVSGKISGNTITLTFKMVDKATSGTKANVTFAYSGTKTTTDLEEITETERVVVAYYSLTGQLLQEEPEKGLYIVKYDNGDTEKVLKEE